MATTEETRRQRRLEFWEGELRRLEALRDERSNPAYLAKPIAHAKRMIAQYGGQPNGADDPGGSVGEVAADPAEPEPESSSPVVDEVDGGLAVDEVEPDSGKRGRRR
jgi:hypothetical protein